MATEDFSVREIGALRPRLRAGLQFSLQEQGGRRVCVIEDPAASRFHRVGLAEYRFLRALDGTRPIAGVLAQLSRDGGEAFTEAEAWQIMRWLRDQRLLETEGSHDRLTDRERRDDALRAAAGWLNPLVLKIPLFRPDRFFTRVEPMLRPFLGWGGFLVWLAVVAAGAAHLGMDWRQFTADADHLLARDNWLWLFLAWTGLKIAHEFSHGLYCKYFGAAVREAGAIVVVFMPMGYIDATASLGLAARGRRMMVAAAGLYMEFFLAALAAIVWARTAPGGLHTVAHNVVVIGTVVTLFFNLNPLMRFDGYFLLSDLLAVPNLATRGRAWLQRALAWVLLGEQAGTSLRPTSRDGWIAAVYGVLACLWQLLVLAGLLLAGSVALRGGGLLLASLAAVTWVALPLVRFGGSIASALHSGRGSLGSLALRLAALVALAGAVIFFPWHHAVTSNGVVELAETEVLRAECPGFVVRENVRDGELVAAGQVLMELSNEEAVAELAGRRLALAKQELKTRLAHTREDVATFQAEQATARALRQEVAERERFLSTLQIRAPFAGRVANRHLGRRLGTFISPGGELLHIGHAERCDVKLAVQESDEPHFRAALGEPVEVRLGPREETLAGRLERVEARASRQPAHAALTALFGGPLALRRADEAPSDRSSPGYELAAPCFNATVVIVPGPALSPGEAARVRFRSARVTTLWTELQAAFARWLRKRAAS